MGEDKDDQIISRRDLIKRGLVVAGLGVGLATAAAGETANELIKGATGIKTKNGIFTPIYERHDIGIDVRDIPRDIDVYFREYQAISPDGISATMDQPVGDILNSRMKVYQGTPLEAEINAFPPEVLFTLAEREAEVMVGDVNPGNFYGNGFSALDLAYVGAAGVGGVSGLPEKITMIPRRSFLKLLGVVASLWGTTGEIGNILMLSDTDKSNRQGALKRIGARVEGMSSDLHPEQIGVFFRNVVIADKMLSVAEQTSGDKGSPKPKIAFQVEMGHSGIEDFLQAGPEVCQAVILAYPKEVLNQLMDVNGGIEKFCTSRLFKLKKGGENNLQVSERRVLDRKLMEGLEKKLTE